MQRIRKFLLKCPVYKQCYGVLMYYYEGKKFRFLIRRGFDFWDYPPIIDVAEQRGQTELTEWEVKAFVENRIIPPNRQNIVDILDSAGLKEYDEFGMLMYTGGRCCQDEMYLEEIDDTQFEKVVKEWDLKV